MKKILLFIFVIFTNFGFGQFKYKPIPDKYIRIVNIQEDYNFYSEKAYNLINILPKGYVTDGSVDYTNLIQLALNKYDIIRFPNFTLSVNSDGLNIRSNTVLLFGEKSILKMIPNDKSGYSLFQIVNKENIRIFNPKLVGDRDNHLSNVGEWGMGICIKGGKNIYVYNSDISSFWGDGIYIGGDKTCESINIIGGIIDNNRRNGISLINGKSILIDRITVSNTNGINPKTGIDLEPNSPSDKLQRVVLSNIITFNNAVSGLSMYLGKLKSLNYNAEINISLLNFKDLYSKRGISYSNTISTKLKELNGSLLLDGCEFYYNQEPIAFLFDNSSLDNIKLNVKDLNINHKNKSKYLERIKLFNKMKIIYNK